MIHQDDITTGNSTTTWATNEWLLCANRLPCGICRLMQTTCPLSVKPYEVTWQNTPEVTCKTEVRNERTD